MLSPTHHINPLAKNHARVLAGDSCTQQQKKERLGAVYTPAFLAEWVASLLLRNLQKGANNLTIVDPAAGEGALLKAIKGKVHQAALYGIDVDPCAVSCAKKSFGKTAHFIKADALHPFPKMSVIGSWRKLLDGRTISGIIANPPWGAQLSQSSQTLRNSGYTLAKGQFDSFGLFIELAISVLPRNGVAVFIIPDSIFQPEHMALRSLLLEKTSLLMIARLGEGFFDGVCRGTTVIACRKGAPSAKHAVPCMRLNKVWRDKILLGKRTLAQAEEEFTHLIPQARFTKDSGHRFDIDLTQEESARISVIEQHINGWSSWLDSTRGVELSKGGRICICPKCGTARPAPRGEEDRWLCLNCGALVKTSSSKQEAIVIPAKNLREGWLPFIVGEDVDRYRVAPSRAIKTNVRGINYKDEEIFSGKKLVIRKTGVGIKAAIDTSGSYTNQVVFIYKPNQNRRPPEFVLEYFQGVLCSRVMLAYYLKKKGDNEWRSHPYLTQKIIAELPVPDIHENDGWRMKQIKAIASAVHQQNLAPSFDKDFKIERLVAGLFGLTSDDCGWILNVLNSAQGLEPIRTLRLSGEVLFEPIRV